MATYFCAATGSNTAPYDTWAKAATSLQTALSAAVASGDVVVLDAGGIPAADAEVAVDTIYTFAQAVSLICSTNSGVATITPTAMGVGAWVGNSTINRSVTLDGGGFKIFVFGLTLRTAGTTADSIVIGGTTNDHFEIEDGYFWHGNGSASSTIRLGDSAANSTKNYIKLVNPTFRFGNVGHGIAISATVEIIGGSISSAGAAQSTAIFRCSDQSDASGTGLNAMGFDASAAASGCALVGDVIRPPQRFEFEQCKLPANFVLLAAQTTSTKVSGQVWVRDCHSGDTHGYFGYADGLGSVVSDFGVYYTAGAAQQSWKITTTAQAEYITPFVTPWIAKYHDGAAAISPYLEILRDGSAVAYDNDEVWAEFSAKTTTTSTRASFYRDRMALMGAPAAQAAGAGLGSWTGESATAWSGRIDSGAAFTPAEVGDMCARAFVGVPGATVYVDPQIRT